MTVSVAEIVGEVCVLTSCMVDDGIKTIQGAGGRRQEAGGSEEPEDL